MPCTSSRLPCYVFCICLLTNKYQKYKSVELGDQLLTRRIVTLQCIEHIRILTSLMEADASQVSHRCTSCIFLRTAHICLHLPFSSNACSSFVNSFTPATSIFYHPLITNKQEYTTKLLIEHSADNC